MSPYELLKLRPNQSNSRIVNAVVETSHGDHNKYDLDLRTGILYLDRPLHSSLVFPANYGYLPQTISGDGDALDVIILSGYPLLAGSVAQCRVVGVLMMKDELGVDPKIISVVDNDPRMSFIQSFDHIPDPLLEELKHFFIHIKDLEDGKWAEVQRFADENVAFDLIESSYQPKETL